MSTKKYKNLDQGSEKLRQNLSKFITVDNTVGKERSYNPLTDARKPKEIESPSVDVLEVEEEIKKPVVKQEKSTLKHDKKVAEIKKPVKKPAVNVNQVKKTEEIKVVPKTTKPVEKVIVDTGEAFRGHSILVSESQLNKLRDAVFLRKANGDRRYSLKDALNEAFTMFLNKRQPCETFPDDFITYSPLVSTRQLEDLYSFVYNLKAKKDSKYAMKYAIYEAIEMYLGEVE